MGISNIGFGIYDSFKSDYRVGNIPKVSNVAEEENLSKENIAASANTSVDVKEAPARDIKSVNPNEISLTFNKGDNFSYIGSEKDIDNLDINKAISDMKQDSILREYNYFVGSANNVFNSEDGRVLVK